jgi:hypothetical protein
MKHLLLLTIFILFFSKLTFAIKCYECQSVKDEFCGNKITIESNKFIVDCDKVQNPLMNQKASICRKIKQTSEIEKF